ncbi:putative Ni/Fe-hydrogenase 1 B-type cytochrome subunit [Methylophilaceae bacterium]|nr:putative Ni/Fe-hydrogenase 1 B-type cytochrome subunit [Methylophilaceae bacterium]
MEYVWDRFVRSFHWLLVLAFAVAFYTHESEWDRNIHIMSGYLAGILILSRIVWGFKAKGYANFHSFPPDLLSGMKYLQLILTGHAPRYIGHNPTGGLVIYAMLAIGALTILTGIVVLNDALFWVDPSGMDTLHDVFAWTWLVLVIGHILGVLLESYLHEENLIQSMLTGYKQHK